MFAKTTEKKRPYLKIEGRILTEGKTESNHIASVSEDVQGKSA